MYCLNFLWITLTRGTFLAIEVYSFSYNLVKQGQRENGFFEYSVRLIAHYFTLTKPQNQVFVSCGAYLYYSGAAADDPTRETKSLFLAKRTASALSLSDGLSSNFWRATTTSNTIVRLSISPTSSSVGYRMLGSLLVEVLGGRPWLRSLSIAGYAFDSRKTLQCSCQPAGENGLKSPSFQVRS